MAKKFIFLLLLLFTGLQMIRAQQTYSIKGIVKDATNDEPVSFANVVIWNTLEGTVTDSIGQFEITGVSPGAIAYKPPSLVINQQSRLNSGFPTRIYFFRSNWKKAVKVCKK